jgi:glycosyltransferase involved in cell wall biosynthesis
MSHPKILYITPALSVGGAEKFLILLSNSLVPEKEKQILVSLKAVNTLQHELDDKINFIALPRNNKFDLKPILKLRRLIKLQQPDIIFCINFYSYLVSRCAMFGLWTKATRIISYHSTIHVTRKEHLLHKFYALLLTKKDSIVTVSTNQAKYTADKYHIPINKFTTIHNGINLQYWYPSPGDSIRLSIRKTYNIPVDAKVIVMTAALRIEKNHTGAVKALHLLHTVYHQKAYLLMVGDGIMNEEIIKLARELNLEDYVKITGMQKEVRPFYWASDLFTLASTSVETFSIAALEAMACGLPCVLTNIGGATEMVSDGLNGYICDLDENDIAKKWSAALIGNFSRETIHAFTRDNFSAEKMLEEYRKIL